jgi:quercetin dioxygenase-like cupin family protein
MIKGEKIEMFDNMYPSAGYMFNNQQITLPNFCKFCSIYGYSYGNSCITVDGKNYQLEKGQYFGLGVNDSVNINAVNKLFVIVRLGYIVPNTIGWVEKIGRLSYIDGCSDSLLVYPARLGDASLNLLYFPPGINQTFHRHPSMRLGCVIDGKGFSEVGESNSVELSALTNEDSFGLIAQERHRFKTTDSSMTVVSFHPDGDWGPTDHNHIMVNRTYQDK